MPTRRRPPAARFTPPPDPFPPFRLGDYPTKADAMEADEARKIVRTLADLFGSVEVSVGKHGAWGAPKTIRRRT